MQAIIETLFDAAYLSTVNEEEDFLSGTKKRLRV